MKILDKIISLFKKKPVEKISGFPIPDITDAQRNKAIKVQQTLGCYLCGKKSGFERITLKKVSKGKYICNLCI